MANFLDTAKGYEPKVTKNIADLDSVSLTVPIEERSAMDKDGKEFSYHVALINGEEYRVPATVLKDVKTIISAKPMVKSIRVIKKGSGIKTAYVVIPLE